MSNPAFHASESLGAGARAAGGALIACLGALAAPLLPAAETPARLTKPETALQGNWKAKSGWLLTFEGRTFRAASGDAWYHGTFSAPVTESDPAPLDIKIEDCNCNYKGLTSKSIYRFAGEELLFSGATPGKSRPPIFDDTMGLLLDMKRVDAGEKR